LNAGIPYAVVSVTSGIDSTISRTSASVMPRRRVPGFVLGIFVAFFLLVLIAVRLKDRKAVLQVAL
jgi:hypothetical protein